MSRINCFCWGGQGRPAGARGGPIVMSDGGGGGASLDSSREELVAIVDGG